MILILATMLACKPQPLTFVTSAEGCQSINFDERGDPTLESSVDDPVQVWLNGVWLPDDSVLSAEVTADGDLISVVENWEEGESLTELCFAPTVTFEGAEAGRFEVFWYRGDADIAYDSVVLTVE